MDLAHEERLSKVEARSESNTHRLDDLERRQDNLDALVSTVAVIANKQEHMDGDLQEIKTTVKSIASKPGKRWESVEEKAILLLVGAIVTYILTQIGL
jgi:hypothetical protein